MLETREQSTLVNNLAAYSSYLMERKSDFSVTRVSFIDGFSEIDLPVAIAYRPNSKVLSQSGGKGVSREQTLISAIMESYECNSAECIIPDKKNYAEINLLDSNQLYIPPKKLPTCTSLYHYTLPIDWSIGYSLVSGESVYVPFDAVSLDFTRMSNIHHPCYMQLTSNGLASGSNSNAAIISAIFEIIERHCVTTHELQHKAYSKPIDIMTVPCEIQKNLIDKIVAVDINIELYDMTLFDSFPVYGCIIKDAIGMSSVGWGCHTDPYISISRAITEANQARTIQISGSREDMNKYDYFSIKKNLSKDDSLASEYVQFDSTKDKELLTLEKLLKLLTHYNIPEPVCIQLDEKKLMCATRVIIPTLHGYNYPAYRSVLSKNYSENIADYKVTATHKPAAL